MRCLEHRRPHVLRILCDYVGFIRKCALGHQPNNEIFPALPKKTNLIFKCSIHLSQHQEPHIQNAHLQRRGKDQHQGRQIDH